MNINKFRPKERFSNRVKNYVKYRPHYPQVLIDVLKNSYSLTNDSVIADIGSGTGIFSKLLLQNDFTVIGVEPNSEMRMYAENYLSQFKKYTSLIGSAENTTLLSDSIDVIAVAQAFHWFNIDSTITEFYRILKQNGLIVLIWNERKVNTDLFHRKYEEAIVKYCKEYEAINHSNITRDKIDLIFDNYKIAEHHFNNQQELDLESLIGRLESSSYCPEKKDKNYNPLMNLVKTLFKNHNHNGRINIEYDCVMFCVR